MSEKVPESVTWEGLHAVILNVDDVPLKDYIDTWPKRYRKAVALALSVAHWMPDFRPVNPYDLPTGHTFCGLCSFHEYSCDGCPLDSGLFNCCRDDSYYEKFIEYSYTTIPERAWYYANKIYNKLVELYEEEWNKL